jgi:hypothetical protein
MKTNVAYLFEEQPNSAFGARVVEPPADTVQAMRGHFYALVELQNAGADARVLSERLLSALQRTYYSERGTQSQVLGSTLNQAAAMIKSEKSTRPGLRAEVICAALLGDKLTLTGYGNGFALITGIGGGVDVLPPERLATDYEVRHTDSIWEVHRQQVPPEAAILLGASRWLRLITPRNLASIVAYVNGESCAEAGDWLKAQAGRNDLPGLLIVSAPESGDGGPSGGSGGGPSGGSGGGGPATSPNGPAALPRQRSALPGLPTALGAAPPVVSAPPPMAEPTRPTPVRAVAPSLSVAPAPEYSPSHGSPITPLAVSRAAVEETAEDDELPGGVAWRDRLAEFVGKSAAASSAALASGLSGARTVVGNLVPDRRPGVNAGPAAPPGFPAGDQPASAGGVTEPAAAAHDFPVASVQPQPAPFVPPPRAQGARARLFVLLAVVILILVPVTVVAYRWQSDVTERVQAEKLLELGEANLAKAQQALDQEDSETARGLLTEAQSNVAGAEGLVGRTGRGDDLLAQIEMELQDVLEIWPLYGLVNPLVTFPTDADPTRIIVREQDIYVMDTGQGKILRYRLDAGGESLIDSAGEVVLVQGTSVDGEPVGAFVDMAWQSPIPGFEDKSHLLVLDSNNRVFRYNPKVEGISLMQFGTDQGGWQRTTQIETYLDRLYVVDEGTNQIYRYAPGQYDQPPEPWFQAPTQVNLANIQSLLIDGDLWALFSSGQVVRYNNGDQLPFALDDSVAPAGEPVDLFIGLKGGNSIFLADAAEEAILVFNKEDGSYDRQFRAAEGRPLRGLSAIYVDETRDTLFILTRTGLYQQRLPQ